MFVALETAASDQEARLSAAEENIQGILVNHCKKLHQKFSSLIQLLINFQDYRQQM